MRRRLLLLTALLLAFTLVAAACGDDDDGGGGDEDGTATTAAPDGDDAETTETTAAPDEGGDDEADGEGGGDAAMAPAYGGDLVFGIEAETNSGWYAPTQQCAASCHVIMRAIYDPLFTENTDGETVPFLAESAEPSNDDFTEWRMRAREGITFHNGEPFDGAAIVAHFDGLKAGTITSQVLQRYEGGEVDPADAQTAILRFSAPVSVLPEILVGQLSYVSAPSAHADPGAAAQNPVGTGPFVFESWSPGESLRVTRNENYWRTDADGNQLPYVDSITFRPIPDNDARYAALASGDLDLLHTDLAEDFADLEDDGAVLEQTDFGVETEYVMLNAASPVFSDPDVRMGLAMCTDQDQYLQLRTDGVSEGANGPFAPGTPGYLEDTGYPGFDPEAGRALIEAAGVTGPIELQGTNGPWNVLTMELLAQMWSDNCGVEVDLEPLEQGENITQALTGEFDALLWRNHGYPIGALERVWWHSDNSGPVGQLAVANFGRIEDPTIDGAFDEIFATRDRAEWATLLEDINRAFGEQVYNVWLEWRPWVIAHDPGLANVGGHDLPDGTTSPTVFTGRIFLDQTYWAE